jgi:hypothetical protein
MIDSTTAVFYHHGHHVMRLFFAEKLQPATTKRARSVDTRNITGMEEGLESFRLAMAMATMDMMGGCGCRPDCHGPRQLKSELESEKGGLIGHKATHRQFPPHLLILQ